MIGVLQPSYWQHVAAGLAVIVPTLLVGGFLLGWFTRSVLEPRAAGRRWPEGARGIRPIVEIIVDIQRREAAEPVAGRERDPRGYLGAARFGLVVAVCAVIPVSTGLVLTQPGLGLYALAVLLAADALLRRAGAASPDSDVNVATWVEIGLAGVVALMAGVVHAQWGTASVSAVVTAQADGAVGNVDIFGLPTMFAHPLTCGVAVVALWMSIVSMDASPGTRGGALPGLVAQLVNQTWVIAIAAWLVAAFAGGGAVPWGIDNPGARQVVSVVVFSTKVSLVAIALAWAKLTWPVVTVRSVRVLLGIGIVVGTVVIGVTLLIR